MCGRTRLYFRYPVSPGEKRCRRPAALQKLCQLEALSRFSPYSTTNLNVPFTVAMLLIPAIDLKDGHCVRLKQGDMEQATVFSDDPAEMARHWLAQGARRLHLVDLNGA